MGLVLAFGISLAVVCTRRTAVVYEAPLDNGKGALGLGVPV